MTARIIEEEQGVGRAADAEAALSPSATAPVVAALPGNDQPRDTVTVDRSRWNALVEFYDQHHGTPCAQVRWHDRECELLGHVCGNASMDDWRIEEMSHAQMGDLLRYIARDARRLSGYDDPKDAAAWVEAYADGRI